MDTALTEGSSPSVRNDRIRSRSASIWRTASVRSGKLRSRSPNAFLRKVMKVGRPRPSGPVFTKHEMTGLAEGGRWARRLIVWLSSVMRIPFKKYTLRYEAVQDGPCQGARPKTTEA